MKNVLEAHGIICSITNQNLTAGLGEIPRTECWPELWVFDEAAEQALQIVNTVIEGETGSKTSWVCPKCGEELEGQFTECWNCGTTGSQH